MEPTLVALPFWELAKLALSTGLAAALATRLIDFGIDSWKLRRSARTIATPLAARLAVVLEKFAIQCADQIADNDLYHSSDGGAGRQHGILPKLGEFPPQLNWETLDPELLSRSLSLANELEIGDRMITFWEDIDRTPGLVCNACDAQAGVLGYRAWRIAKDLRTRYKLGAFTPNEFSWDRVETLKQHHDSEIARIREHQTDQEAP